jgi:hypothetical protein
MRKPKLREAFPRLSNQFSDIPLEGRFSGYNTTPRDEVSLSLDGEDDSCTPGGSFVASLKGLGIRWAFCVRTELISHGVSPLGGPSAYLT